MSPNGWEAIVAAHPWPDSKPKAKPRHAQFFKPEHERLLRNMMDETDNDDGPIVELGSYFGDSAEFMLNYDPISESDIICIDTWLGSRFNHGPNPTWRGDLDGLFEAFQSRLWSERYRCLPLRVDSITGLWLLRDYEIRPRFFYVDAGHEYWSVRADLETIKELFPGVPVGGDDWSPGNDVARAVEDSVGTVTGDPVSGVWKA